jgi:signal transduction histidine kinase
MPVLINIYVIKELYKFINEYYKDKTLADFIISNFADRELILESENISSEIFFKILSYMQKISGDQLICFNAGRHFAKNYLFRQSAISGIAFSSRRRYRKIPKILESEFYFISVTKKSSGPRSITLTIKERDENSKTNIYFYEYLKGIISSLPEISGLPFADVKIISYQFHLEDILKDLDIIYQKKDDGYYIFDSRIGVEKPAPSAGAAAKENNSKTIQTIAEEIYLRDIYLRKNTVLNADSVELTAAWKNISLLAVVAGIIITAAGIGLFSLLYLRELLPIPLWVSSIIIYSLFFLLLKAKLKTRELKKIYKDSESGLLDMISEHRNTASEAISNTQNRLRAIENIMEITKKIIYEKNIVSLFDTIRKRTAEALNADRATVFIHDSENHELRSGPELSEEGQEFRIPETKGIAGEIFKLKKIINVKDAYNNPNFDKTVDRKTGYHTKTILGAPLIDLGNNFVGVIQVLNKKGDLFEAVDEKILETLSAYIASALKDTLHIRNLEQRVMNPVIQKGLNNVIQYIFHKNQQISQQLKNNDPSAETVVNQLDELSTFIKKLLFVFNESYAPDLRPIKFNDITKKINHIIESNTGKKKIDYNFVTTLSTDRELRIDPELTDYFLNAILLNGIEAIADHGEIRVSVFNYIKIPNEIIHEFSISEVIEKYNQNEPQNSNIFIEFLKNYKPLLESDLSKITGAMTKYIAFDFYDTGVEIERDQKQKIFFPFFSTRNQFGLGLAVASNAIKRMSGIIDEPRAIANGKFIRVLIPDVMG